MDMTPTCGSGFKWDWGKKACVIRPGLLPICTKGQYYSQTAKKCVDSIPVHPLCPKGKVWGGKNCILKGVPTPNPSIRVCPKGEVWGGKNCILKGVPTPNPSIRVCPKGEVWDDKKCVPIPASSKCKMIINDYECVNYPQGKTSVCAWVKGACTNK